MVTNEDDWQNSNLTRLFDKATSLYENLESSSSSPNDNSKCLLILEECQRRIMTLGLFSSNETIEDLQTSSIRYKNKIYPNNPCIDTYSLNIILGGFIQPSVIIPPKTCLIDFLNWKDPKLNLRTTWKWSNYTFYLTRIPWS